MFLHRKLYCNFRLVSHNVPAVCDVLPARIRALRNKDQGWQNVPEQRRGNEAKRNDLAVVEAEPPTGGEALTDLLCEVHAVFIIFYIYNILLILHSIFPILYNLYLIFP
jgi:hypothetical protein